MEKVLVLKDEIKDSNNNKIAEMTTYLRGDGSTPVVQTIGGMDKVIGFNDNGSAILAKHDDETIKAAQQRFMAEAIKEQKKLCVANGVDPDLVNIIGLEKKERNKNE